MSSINSDPYHTEEAKRLVVNNQKILTISALTIGGVVLAPIVFVGLVQVIGFGSGGIVAGSFAAWMMSLQGGATAAGSLVAILQSIGAAGISLGATVATSAGGGTFIGILSTLIMKILNANPEGRAQLNEFEAFDQFLKIFTSIQKVIETKKFKFLIDENADNENVYKSFETLYNHLVKSYGKEYVEKVRLNTITLYLGMDLVRASL
ncbi:22573_t:CDS:2 [Cetraspora pellucida]|uniref:22573_t:CDS:1 n=1 Tax=Cetraspora pellucida TaxID=1433469 RepID=A0A9N8VMS3_9GLOM|nr:22573_t:CDS:2 [Cetraspora pellucida]